MSWESARKYLPRYWALVAPSTTDNGELKGTFETLYDEEETNDGENKRELPDLLEVWVKPAPKKDEVGGNSNGVQETRDSYGR